MPNATPLMLPADSCRNSIKRMQNHGKLKSIYGHFKNIYLVIEAFKTSMHSSRMRTGRGSGCRIYLLRGEEGQLTLPIPHIPYHPPTPIYTTSRPLYYPLYTTPTPLIHPHPCVNTPTPVKTLPSPILRMRPVIKTPRTI